MSEVEVDDRPQAIIMGAGLAGLYMLHRLRKRGMKVLLLEAAHGVGGTWYWNRYPGARCDVESEEYSYSFDEQLQQDWQWTERYATQPEILRYINHVADRFDLRRDIRFNSRVQSVRRDDAANHWTVSTQDGASFTARFCISAVGCLALPNMPAFKGRDNFGGKLYHTGLWPHEGVDFTGLRVGVIGTGSSGMQAIPLIAKDARHLYVFQRTPNYSLPAHNRPLDKEAVAQQKKNYAALRELARRSPIGVGRFPAPTQSVFDVSEAERQRAYQGGWDHGSTRYTRIFNDTVKTLEANAIAANFIKDKIRSLVRDPAVAAMVTPSYPIGTKRVVLDTDYFETLNRDNVTVVDVKADPIDCITETGLRTASGAHCDLDAIVFATGFDAITGALLALGICKSDGNTLARKWEFGPKAYLGLMTAGYPNLFLVTGPGSPSVLSNVVTSIEQHVDLIVDCLDYMDSRGYERIDADPQAEERWVAEVNEIASNTLLAGGNSWYLGANIEGKPRVFMPYAGGVGTYRAICEQIVADGYPGFVME